MCLPCTDGRCTLYRDTSANNRLDNALRVYCANPYTYIDAEVYNYIRASVRIYYRILSIRRCQHVLIIFPIIGREQIVFKILSARINYFQMSIVCTRD